MRFQEADIVGISRSVTKHNYLVSNRKDLGRILREAFHIARTGRPGPVLVDIPKDVLTEASAEPIPESVSIRGYNPVYRGHPLQIRRAAQVLAEAKRPLFYAGGGITISGASVQFRELIARTGVPVVASLMGIGTLPSDHPRFLGMLGMHGTYAANIAVQNCDLLFAIGSRFDDRATGNLKQFAPHATVVHVDIDPSSNLAQRAGGGAHCRGRRTLPGRLPSRRDGAFDQRLAGADRGMDAYAPPGGGPR